MVEVAATGIIAAAASLFAYRAGFRAKSREIKIFAAVCGVWTFAAIWLLLMLAYTTVNA